MDVPPGVGVCFRVSVMRPLGTDRKDAVSLMRQLADELESEAYRDYEIFDIGFERLPDTGDANDPQDGAAVMLVYLEAPKGH